MIKSNSFKDFTLYPKSFKTKTADPALTTLDKMSTAPAQTVSTAAPKINQTIVPDRLKTAQDALSTPAPVSKGTTQQTATGGTDPATQQPYEPIPKANTGGPGSESQVPTGETDTTTTDPFDYTNYANDQTGPITDAELTNWSGDSRTKYDDLVKQEQNWQKILDDNLKAMAAAPNKAQRDMAADWVSRARKQLSDITTEKDKLVGQFRSDYATDHAGDQWLDFLTGIINNWDTSYTDDTTVAPFESEWSDIFGDAFGDLSDFGSSTDFLKAFAENFGIDQIITGQVNWGDFGFENYSPDALKKFIESGANIPGFEYDESNPDVTQEEQFIKFLMDEATKIRDRIQSVDFEKLSPILSQAQATRLTAATQLLNQPGLSQQEFDNLLNRNMIAVRRDAESQKREIDLQTGLQLAGASTKSSSLKRLVEQDVMMAEAQVRGDLTEMDVKLRQENYQKGIEELGSLSRDEISKLTQALGIEGDREGQVLSYLAEVGRIALGSIDTQQTHYENRLKMAQDFYGKNADRTLQEKLGQADLDLKLYDVTTDAGLEEMRLAYQTKLQNRGMNIDEAKANADNLLETYKLGQSFAQMDINKLAMIADLAAKAQDGDRQAWGAYNSMVLEERLKNRGMDIDEAQSVAQLAYGIWTTEKQQALTMWVEKYRGDLERELAQFAVDNQPSPWLKAVGDLFGGIGAIAPFLKGKTNTDTGTPPGDYNTGTEGLA